MMIFFFIIVALEISVIGILGVHLWTRIKYFRHQQDRSWVTAIDFAWRALVIDESLTQYLQVAHQREERERAHLFLQSIRVVPYRGPISTSANTDEDDEI
jgi:hypothetical protein